MLMNVTPAFRRFLIFAIGCFLAIFARAQTGSMNTSASFYSGSGGSVTFDVTFDYTGQSLSTLGVNIMLPAGWSFASASGSNVPPIAPSAGTTQAAEFAYFTAPANAVSFSLTLDYAAGLSGAQSIGGVVLYKIQGDDTARQESLGPIVLAEAIAPQITSQPVSANVNQGESVTFSATVSGVPTPTLQWQRDGVNLEAATDSTFEIASVSGADAGNYTLVATNSVGSATSSAAELTVNIPPSISTQPQSQTIAEGTNLTLSVVASGVPAPSYQWRKNTTPISGETSSSLTINDVSSGDSGDYDVVVTNVAGSVTSTSATVLVQNVPVIGTQPEGGVFISGDELALNVVATGAGSLTYQWRKDGSDIDGATGVVYTIPALVLASAGTYDVVVSNAGGSTTSVAVAVAVIELSGTHAISGRGYKAGDQLTINSTLTYAGDVASFGWSVMPPDPIDGQKWSFVSSGEGAGPVAPAAGDTDLFEWAWTSTPPSPVEFSYTLNVPDNVVGEPELTAVVLARSGGAELMTTVKPDPLRIPEAPSTHDADSDGDNKIGLGELLRVIELYNTREGTRRTGEYHSDGSTVDGFAPGPEPSE
ncbi:MAG: hypothetical protein SynsKO_05260 [Synoicihabitans sp.]